MRGELHRPGQRVGLGRQRPVNVEIELVIAGFALDIVDVDMHLRAVAEVEEPRQRRGDDDGIAHDHVRLRRADFGLRPCDRHHPHRTVEGGDVEGHVGRAVGADLDDAGEERERRLGRQIAFQIAAVVAAGLKGAGDAFHAVDQQPVEIADVDGELALAEEKAARVRRLVSRQIEDADVDRGDRDLGLFAGREAADLDRQGQGLARPGLVRRVDRDVELARALVDAEPGEAQRAAGHALGLDVERAMGQRDRVGARAPIRADLERHDIVALGEIDVDELLELVADQGDRRFALEMRGDAQLGLFARGVVGLVERHDDVVGRVGARRARPADVEGDAGLFAVGRLHVEPMAAPADLRADLRRRVGADVDASLRRCVWRT